MSLSVCIIARRNEPLIGSALNSVVSLAEEIILVDTGLDKASREMANEFSSANPGLLKIVDFEWNDDFSAARNISLRTATKDWIFVIDCDEVADRKGIRKLLEKAKDKPNLKGFAFVQKTHTNKVNHFGFIPERMEVKLRGQKFSFEGYFFCNMVRLFKNEVPIYYENPVHESVDNSIRRSGAKIAKTNVPIHHFKELKGIDWDDRTQVHYLSIYEKNLEKFTNKAKAYADLGLLNYAYRKDYPAAIEHLEKAMIEYSSRGQDPNPRALMTLAYSYFMSDRFNKAKEHFEQFLDKFPEHPSTGKAKSALQMISERN